MQQSAKMETNKVQILIILFVVSIFLPFMVNTLAKTAWVHIIYWPLWFLAVGTLSYLRFKIWKEGTMTERVVKPVDAEIVRR